MWSLRWRGSLGSPPRMRGKGLRPIHSGRAKGITPAYAGKSVACVFADLGQWDHPRVCGEKLPYPQRGPDVTGSPPRMRGKGHKVTGTTPHRGITPAYAGKRCSQAIIPMKGQDHPRVCGEKYDSAALLSVLHRITPAYAGKRLKRSRSTVPHAAIVPLFPSVCNKPAGSDGSPAGHDAPPFLPIENAVPASPAYNLRSL